MTLEAFKDRILETLKRAEYPPTVTDLMFNPRSPAYIQPSDYVLIVGPGVQLVTDIPFSLPMDRSPIVLAPYLSKSEGRLTILDAPAELKGRAGEDGIPHYQRWFKSQNAHIPLCPIDYAECDLLRERPTLSDNFNCIVDHLTTCGWLLMDVCDFEGAIEIARQTITLYVSLLEQGGKMILHYTKTYKPFRKSALEQAMVEHQLNVTDIYPIADIYKLPKALRKMFQRFGYMSRGLDSKNRLKSVYTSEGILVGKRSK